ncbi:MAG: L-threonylcarbamoyladenylate synthase [Pseudomonadota bacterium]
MTAPIVPPSDASIARAADILQSGGLVAMPTETVYGLACDAANPKAVACLYAAKGRPSFNPLIAHVLDLDAAQREGHFSETAQSLAAKYWPGPLTLVVPVAASHTVCDLARAGLDTIALRSPKHPVARTLLSHFGGPIVAPSANPSGQISPTHPEHVLKDMGDKVDLILDGGPCEIGIESTILSCLLEEDPTLLRAGSIDAGAPPIGETSETTPIAPGQLSRHYAPKASLRLNVTEPNEGEAHLGFGSINGSINLSSNSDLEEAAANLFAMLRSLDTTHRRIAVAPIPHTGIGMAINDRLARAAKRD